MYLQGKDILVLGAGASGVAATRLASAHHADVTLFDNRPEAISGTLADELKHDDVSIVTGEISALGERRFDLAVFSPGIPMNSQAALFAQTHSSAITGELAFGASFIQAPILAVTGTNGKTTTVEMLAHLLAACGKRTLAAGNIGLPLSQVALQKEELDCVVAEVSSFQLELADDFRPFAAALLNITPDHLNRHGSMENYQELKFSIFRNITEPARCIVNAKLVALAEECTTFSADENFSADFSAHLLDGAELPFQGQHNRENALAATALAATLGIRPADAIKALGTFHTGHHRLETVASSNGIEFIDDSKATNVDALLKALTTLRERDRRPIALIAGGVDKGSSLEEAIPELTASRITHVALIGTCAPRLAERWGSLLSCGICASMQDAVSASIRSLPEGGVVLLSPACASQDMFRDYAERGELFAAAARDFCSMTHQSSINS